MKKKVKILYFVDRMLKGGIQSQVINWVSRINKEKFQIDFLLLDEGKDYSEEEQVLKELGCNIYKLTGIWIRTPFDFIKEAKALDYFFKGHHDYKVVHMHSSSKNYMVLKYAKKYGIPIRIAHAHATDFQTNSFAKKIVGDFLKPKLIKYSTNYFACTKEAGKWLFGKKIINSDKFMIIKNGIDYKKFIYDEQKRKEVREEYKVKNEDILIGHIGRFTKVKNHIFMVDILYNLIKENKNYKLMFVGEGILKTQIKDKIKKLGLENNVIFTGFQQDVSKYLSAFDIFIFPSIYEGLGVALVEAQANGLPCLATKGTIPEDVKLSENLEFIDLKLDKWIDRIKNIQVERNDTFQALKDKGYMVEDSIDMLSKVYEFD